VTAVVDIDRVQDRRAEARQGHPLLAYLSKRLLALVLTVLASSFFIYSSSRLIPGDPVTVLTKGKITDPDAIARLKADFRLDQPLLRGFRDWIKHGLQGDFGTSISYREPVVDLVQSRLPVTLHLVAYAVVLMILFGMAFGALGALRSGPTSRLVSIVMTLFVAVPGFVTAALLILFFSVQIPIFPAFGAGEGFIDRTYHLTLPAVALSLTSIALTARVTQVAMEEQLQMEHVQTATSRGLRRGQVVRRHVVRNSMIPMVTTVGMCSAYLIVGAVVIESAFGLNGVGTLLTTSVLQRDFAVVQLIVLMMVVTFTVVNTAVDVVYTLLDPRIRLGGAEA
jgi:peptide/nickel transport system permease protein